MEGVRRRVCRVQTNNATTVTKPTIITNTNHNHFGSSHFCSNTALIVSCREDLVFLPELLHKFSVLVPRRRMPRKGWSTVQVPDGWLKTIRGPRPQSTQWPRRRPSSKPPAKGRGSQVSSQQEATHRAQRGLPPEEVLANARARVTKLETAVAAVGESDPSFPAHQEALKKAKAQAQVRPVEDRISSTKVFIERAKKRVNACRAEGGIGEGTDASPV